MVEDRSGDGEGPGPADVHGTEDATLGGYLRVHERPPAFEGRDGQPYTVSIEVEKTPDLARPFIGYLVFPRWAETGVGIVGHVESPILWRGTTRDDVLERAGGTPLLRVKELLDEAIGQREDRRPQGGGRDEPD
ncbi:MAG TPA: hypothetical protein VE173_09405 [Longimicrobiales bacterium]|nr:hypothetical protein [Longimicrobiales bacterium]